MLGGMGILPRDLREAAEGLFPGGPVAPGSVPLFGERLLSQFAGQSSPVFQTGDGDEYRWCETRIEVGSARKVWPLLIRPCLEPPSPPIRNADGYYAYLKSLPGRFWTRNTPDEIEYAGEIQPGRLTNLGTIRRGVKGFTVNANSVRRAADLEAVVLAAASAAGCPAEVTRRSALTADELAGTLPEMFPDPESAQARGIWCVRADDAALSAAWVPAVAVVALLNSYCGLAAAATGFDEPSTWASLSAIIALWPRQGAPAVPLAGSIRHSLHEEPWTSPNCWRSRSRTRPPTCTCRPACRP